MITTSEIFNRKYRFDPSSIKPQGKHFKWTDLKAGDFVVHEDFGIGRYLGIKKIYYTKPDGEEIEDSDCLNIEYARGDRLYVPIQDFTLVQKYISSEGKTPRLSHMDTKTCGNPFSAEEAPTSRVWLSLYSSRGRKKGRSRRL